MSIKQSIASLVILLSVSFSAFADLVMISQLGTATVNECSGYKVGDVVEIGYSADLSGRYGNGLKCKSLLVGGLSVRVEYYNSNGSIGSGSLYVVPYSNKCPDGQVINPDTGKCENPPPPPFCSRPDTISQMNQFESSCLADGGSPTIICNDKVNPPDLRMSCDVPPPKPDPDECTPIHLIGLHVKIQSQKNVHLTHPIGTLDMVCVVDQKTIGVILPSQNPVLLAVPIGQLVPLIPISTLQRAVIWATLINQVAAVLVILTQRNPSLMSMIRVIPSLLSNP